MPVSDFLLEFVWNSIPLYPWRINWSIDFKNNPTILIGTGTGRVSPLTVSHIFFAELCLCHFSIYSVDKIVDHSFLATEHGIMLIGYCYHFNLKLTFFGIAALGQFFQECPIRNSFSQRQGNVNKDVLFCLTVVHSKVVRNIDLGI